MLYAAKREEGSNDSTSLALYARAIIQLEEDRAMEATGLFKTTNGFTANEIPEQARFLDVVVSKNPKAPGNFTVVATRFLHERRGNIELVKCRVRREDDSGSAVPSYAPQDGAGDIMMSPQLIELYNTVELVGVGTN